MIPGTVLPKTDFVADLLVESDKNISVTRGDTILFPLKVEPKSILTVEHWVGDSLLYSEQFTVTDSLFNYKMVPKPGDNRVTFKLTDRFGNTTTTDVFITRVKDIISPPIVRPEYSRIIAKNQAESITEMPVKTDSKITPPDLAGTSDIIPEKETRGGRLWYLWLVLAGFAFILFIIFSRKKKKKDKE
jgi:hypothetical protein